MASKFRVFHIEINLKLDRIVTVVLSCSVRHNLLRRSCNSYAADVQDESEEEQVISWPHYNVDTIDMPVKRAEL